MNDIFILDEKQNIITSFFFVLFFNVEEKQIKNIFNSMIQNSKKWIDEDEMLELSSPC
jgi:hypothetical protein